jgi:cysteine desulfurase
MVKDKRLFLDANAHVPMDVDLYKKAHTLCEKVGCGHPLSPSLPGRNAAKTIEFTREKIAEFIGAKSANQIIFTRGCTQACEWGLKMFCGLTHEEYGCIIFATSSFEHSAVAQAEKKYTEEYCDCGAYFDYKKFGITGNGVIEYSDDADKLVCMHVHNEFGTIQPIDKIKAGSIFSDMAQSLGKIPVNVDALGVDMAVFSAHKFGGPSSVGWIYLKNTELWEQFGTGSRYSLDIPGTPSVVDIFMTGVALERALKTLPERSVNMLEFTTTFEEGIKAAGCRVIAESADRVPNTSFIQLPKTKNSTEMLFELEKYGIYCGLGSACNSLYGGKSPVLKAMWEDDDLSRYMRISQWGQYNKKDAEYVLNIFEELLK